MDVNSPIKFQNDLKTLLFPMTFNVRTTTLPNLYAGKMHALLKIVLKGEIGFDFEWCVKNNSPLNLEYLCQRMKESENFKKDILTKEEFVKLFYNKIDTLDI